MPFDCNGLTGGGESTCSGVNCFGGDGGLIGLSCLVGDRGPTGDGPMGDMGAKGGGAGVIAGIRGVDKSTVRSGLLFPLAVRDDVSLFVSSSLSSDKLKSRSKSADSLLAACLSR